MGYVEHCCQLCAVSLNIARLRTKDEPESAGWGFLSGPFYCGDPASARCAAFPEQSGCENVPDETVDWVHFPGLGCTYVGGYNGLKIRAEEMKGMNRPRYIVKRPEDKEIDGYGPQYEEESDYFLTSQTTCPPDDLEPGELEHVRYEIDNFFPQNYSVVGGSDQEWGVPIHDSCWKIFERVCKQRLGKVDLQGFMALWMVSFEDLRAIKCADSEW